MQLRLRFEFEEGVVVIGLFAIDHEISQSKNEYYIENIPQKRQNKKYKKIELEFNFILILSSKGETRENTPTSPH